ncbi:MAG: MucB/RseB C-terminal domain-containing protein [Rhodocyclaceae bacterium]|nr:MucB/RseB C-terminal domain-containing protein [Rhodocyclaceae bacterium]MBX3668373.1 MucB/RseB C-terminal domain-containing protein [Rhodocyclaceae bacterium]
MKPFWWPLPLAAASLFVAFNAIAESTPPDAAGWLTRAFAAAQKLDYSGVFSYQSGAREETSSVLHAMDGDSARERLEVLDGSPREILRSPGEVRCVLPLSHTIIIERGRVRKSFPALLPESVTMLQESYTLRLAERARIAGMDSQSVELVPRDPYRYGRKVWLDSKSGLLLKAKLIDERGETIETFAFKQLRLGQVSDPEQLKSRYDATSPDWKIQSVEAVDMESGAATWSFRNAVPGFRQVAVMRRQAGGGGNAAHVVFSDGMAAVSVFIEPSGSVDTAGGTKRVGATQVYRRVTGGDMVTLVGDVPLLTLQRLGDGLEVKKR